jgi:hypothetical protein
MSLRRQAFELFQVAVKIPGLKDENIKGHSLCA